MNPGPLLLVLLLLRLAALASHTTQSTDSVGSVDSVGSMGPFGLDWLCHRDTKDECNFVEMVWLYGNHVMLSEPGYCDNFI